MATEPPLDVTPLAADLSQALRARGIVPPGEVDCRELVSDWIAAIEQSWPALRRDLAGFLPYVAERVSEDHDALTSLRALHIDDLYLSYLCSKNDAAAVQAFSRVLAPELRAAALQLKAAERLEEVRQIVWQKLFSPSDGKRPRILDYSGRGKLRSWFRVTTVRSLLDEIRRDRAEERMLQGHAVLSVPPPQADPETEYLKELYSEEFRRAFQAAALALTPEERNMLRGYYAENLNIDQLAMAFGIHRATAARRVRSARDRLLDDTRRRLRAQLKITAKELDSIMRLLESRLQLSVQRLFEPEQPPQPDE